MIKTDKKSLQEAHEHALDMSNKFPEITYTVMNKKQKRSAVYSEPWCVEQQQLAGWDVVARYKGGRMLDN